MNELLDSPFAEVTEDWKPVEGNVHEETIFVIREICNLHRVKEPGLLALAGYLNENREARHSWPGEDLFELLREVFADGAIHEYDLSRVQNMFDRIESFCGSRSAGIDRDIAPLNSVREEELTLPRHDWEGEITGGNETHLVDLKKHRCDCAEFKNKRSGLKDGDLKACCKHMARACDHRIQSGVLNECPPILRYVFADLNNHEEGICFPSTRNRAAGHSDKHL
ncbi:MAG: hypothetical protein CMO80_22820 [Verrucomicrobiales bacterium]|nr:hypothetical protein [Verrucomicrobiales bacterium]|tara:strand:- start:6305 stop:6976 length:672 start_codon:yes stop_codon:yes gene_type:complete